MGCEKPHALRALVFALNDGLLGNDLASEVPPGPDENSAGDRGVTSGKDNAA